MVGVMDEARIAELVAKLRQINEVGSKLCADLIAEQKRSADYIKRRDFRALAKAYRHMGAIMAQRTEAFRRSGDQAEALAELSDPNNG